LISRLGALTKSCANCKLLNPDSAERCDCGYDFASAWMQSSYLSARDRRGKAGAVGGVLAFLFLLRLVAIVNGFRRGILAGILGVGVLVLLVRAVARWQKYSSRDTTVD
jgi:hypothetical protein